MFLQIIHQRVELRAVMFVRYIGYDTDKIQDVKQKLLHQYKLCRKGFSYRVTCEYSSATYLTALPFSLWFVSFFVFFDILDYFATTHSGQTACCIFGLDVLKKVIIECSGNPFAFNKTILCFVVFYVSTGLNAIYLIFLCV